MGVRNLWDILESCKKTLPLHHLQNKRVCIDLSCWLVQLHNVNKTHCALRSKLYLQCLFHRLRALIALNCCLILVTDGAIPSIKLLTYRRRLNVGTEVNPDERKADKVSSLQRNMGSGFSCMMKEAKILGNALGIPCLDGVEEAEAQCALLNSESLCDACFTSDSDAFLFGARTVYRDICLGEGGYVVCYEMADIERKLGFGRNSLISLAVILGGDYSQGVHGVGRESAFQILKSVDDNSVLQQIASEGLSFLKKAKGSKMLANVTSVNREGDATRAEIDVRMNKEFIQVIDAYLKPKCHQADSDVVNRVLGVYPFNRHQLQQTCMQFFDWPPEKTDEYILPKIAERELRRYANLRYNSSKAGVNIPMDEMPVKCPVSSILKRRKLQGRDYFEVSWENMHGLKTSVVPTDLVESACPKKILEFQEEKAQGKKRNQRIRRPKKSGDELSVKDVDLKLQKLLLDIENENRDAEADSFPGGLTAGKSGALSEEPDLSREDQGLESASDGKAGQVSNLGCKLAFPSFSEPEIIDLSTPLPIKVGGISKLQGDRVDADDIIDLSESENETSLDQARKARELRLFIAGIKDDWTL